MSDEEKNTATPITPRKHRHRNRFMSGLLVLVPLWITVFVMETVFAAMASFLEPLIRQLPFEFANDRNIVFLISVGAFLILLYLAGWITAYVLGRRFVAFWEAIILRIPVVKSIYSAAKQVVDAFSLSKQTSFKSVVLIEHPRIGLKALGFVSGTILDVTGKKLVKVFVPTSPNPTTGYLQFVEEKDLVPTDITVEQGVKMLVSGGVVAPADMKVDSLQSNDGI